MAIKIGKSKISNSYRGLRFKIGRADIENGQPNDPCNCAAARALRRQFDAREVFVFRDVTYILKKDGNALRFHTSAPLRLETIVFDRNGEFYPGEYDLDPAPLTNEAKRRTNGNGHSSPSARRRTPKTRHTIPNVRPTASQRLPRV